LTLIDVTLARAARGTERQSARASDDVTTVVQ
jgi:hypothetical protein